MKQGTIIKIISNQYTVENDEETIIARPAGKMRRQSAPVVGDHVQYEQVQDSYRILKILPRKNRLLRPAVANVDQALIVTSCKDPDFSIHLLDRLIILVSLSDVEPVICLTKWDLIGENDRVKIKEQIDALQACGYKAVWTYPGSDDSALREVLDHKVSVLCG
ncbi:GTPase RsgA, partial [uncultured Dubosiella sp.]